MEKEMKLYTFFQNKYGNDTTTNFDLIKWAKELKIKPFYYCMRDEIYKLKSLNKFYAIVNIHKSNQKGVHHSAIYKNGNDFYFFDSYGLPPTKEVISLADKQLWNTFKIQNFGDKNCGQLSLFVLWRLSLGDDFENIILNLVIKNANKHVKS